MKRWKIVSAITLLFSFCLPVNASSEIQTLIIMLHENGTVSDEQFARLQAELEQNRAQRSAEKQKVYKQISKIKKEQNTIVNVKNGLSVQTQEGDFLFKLGGRVQADAATYHGQPAIGDGTEIRRARIYIQGRMYCDWGYKLQYDFANTGAHGKGIADAFISYNGFEDMQLKIGNFKDPFSLQDQTSSKYVLFTERALPEAFTAGRHIGVMASKKQQHWSLAGGVFGDTLTKTNGTDHDQNEGWGAGVRATYAPVNKKTKLIHFGLGLNYRDTGGSGTASFKQQAETHIAGINIVDTGTINNVKDIFKTGAEIAVIADSFSAQAEYMITSVNRNNMKNLRFDGWYAQAGYFLTGESRHYKKGAFGSIVPRYYVGEGGIGAWELGFRYSSLDLTDLDVNGGQAESITLGVNWYPTPTLRFSANYIDVLDIKGGSYHNQTPELFQIRSQWAF